MKNHKSNTNPFHYADPGDFYRAVCQLHGIEFKESDFRIEVHDHRDNTIVVRESITDHYSLRIVVQFNGEGYFDNGIFFFKLS